MSADGLEGTRPDDGWEARLSLRFAAGVGRTELVGREHLGPLRVQRPFYPEPGGVCHVYVLHPPGGVVGGDKLAITAEVEAGAHALLTTPAATKLYRSAGPRSDVRQTLRVRGDAYLEWLPQETIAFSGAVAELTTRVELEVGARFLGWELLCLGRPAGGERFDRGNLGQRIEIVRAGKLVYRERGKYPGGSTILDAAWGLQGQPVVATLLCAGTDLAPHLPQLREVLNATTRVGRAAISCMGELAVARYLGPSTEEARACLVHLWAALRPFVCALPAHAPRIWAT